MVSHSVANRTSSFMVSQLDTDWLWRWTRLIREELSKSYSQFQLLGVLTAGCHWLLFLSGHSKSSYYRSPGFPASTSPCVSLAINARVSPHTGLEAPCQVGTTLGDIFYPQPKNYTKYQQSPLFSFGSGCPQSFMH